MSLRLLLLFLLLPLVARTTHNRAGEIIIRADGDCGDPNDQLRVCATIITYTEIAQTDVDRDSLEIDWGDGTREFIQRTRIVPNVNGARGIQLNEYTFCHRYPTFGRYFVSFRDLNRVRNVQNIPSSVNIPFSVFTSFSLVNPLVLNGCNSTPELTQAPIDNACIGSVWTHNPGAFDIDGDSIAFEFTTPSRAPGVPISSYILPNMVAGASSLTIDERTGQITWDAPTRPGEYNLAFFVKSFRNGIPLDTVVRDMQIFVDNCSNEPPEIQLPTEEICVVAGEVVEFDVVATAPLTDENQLINLSFNDSIFSLTENRATFLPEIGEDDFREDPVTRTFRWQTTCSDVNDQDYIVVFRAQDNGPPQPTGLATLRAVSIKVVAPPPENLQSVADEDLITISWDKPYTCEDTEQPDFLGFTVWRREGSNPFTPDTCETGLSGRGYTLLTPVGGEIMDMEDGRYVYRDTDVERGRTYCYRIVALMALRTESTGLIFDEIESIPSEEICVQLARDIPLLTKVDVTNTGGTAGEVDVCWILPDPLSLDTLLNTGPYRYVLSRAIGQTSDPALFTEIQTFTTQFFDEPVDTCYTDSNLDTEANAYSYRIELFVEGEDIPVGEAQPASTVRLNVFPTDERNELDWSEIVPWTNLEYDVFRRLPASTTFDSLTTVSEMNFTDEGLSNGLEYCYFVRSVGSYNIDNIPSPLLNRSQEVCVTPTDNVPPCPPTLTVESVCDRGVDCTIEDNLFNTLRWVSPTDICGDDDVAGYRVFFSPDSTSTPSFIAQIESPDLLSFDDMPAGGITGCYTVTALDVNGNESEASNVVCVTNCPIYELPNAFTPNGDGQNDFFQPRGLCFVERVEFQIFNRWGQLVFETEDPGINWDGTNLNGESLSSGTYYYVGQVFERRLEGVVASASPVSGFIELFAAE